MTVLSAETHLSFRVLTYSLGNVHCWRIVLGQGLIAVPLGSFLSCKLSAACSYLHCKCKGKLCYASC